MFRNPLLTGLALGAGATYFFDAAHGARRRKLVADQCHHLIHAWARNFDVSWRDLKNRTQGTFAQARQIVSFEEVPDDVLLQRVRSTLGHCVTPPRQIEVRCQGGHVVLSGKANQAERPDLLQAANSVPGVKTVTDEFSIDSNDPSQRRSRASRDWASGTKLLAGTVGAALLANCLAERRRSIFQILLGTAGFGLLIRSLGPLQGSARNWRSIEFHKSLSIHAPVEKVFAFITQPGNWERITPQICNFQWLGSDSFAKDVAMPGGVLLHCVERIVCHEENACFAAESLPESMLTYQKELRFERDGEHTRVHLTFNYEPPGGAIGHAVGAMFGIDAKSFFNDFLLRAKTYLETGLQPHDAAKREFSRRASAAGPAAPPHEAAPNQAEDFVSPLGF